MEVDDVIESADMKILDACTKCSRWLQKLTGLTNYFIAKIGVGMTALSIIVGVANYFHQFLVDKSNIFFVVVGSLYIMILVIRSYFCDLADKEIQGAENALPKIRQISGSSTDRRMFWLGFSFIDMVFLARTIWVAKFPLMECVSSWFSVGLVIFYYFVAVDPLPPGKSKVKEWLEKFKFSLGLKPEAVPVKN